MVSEFQIDRNVVPGDHIYVLPLPVIVETGHRLDEMLPLEGIGDLHQILSFFEPQSSGALNGG